VKPRPNASASPALPARPAAQTDSDYVEQLERFVPLSCANAARTAPAGTDQAAADKVCSPGVLGFIAAMDY
jgi:hypothetical protein